MAMLDLATMQDWLRRQQQGAAPPPEPQGAPPLPPSAPAVSDVSAQPSELERLMQTYRQYVTDYSPEKLQAAQAQDRSDVQGNRYAQMMGNATGLMINNPGAVKIPEPMPMAVKDWAMRREVGKESIGQQQSMMAMDPNGPIAAAKGAALGSLGIKFPPGTSPMVMDSYLAALKAGADPMKVAAEIRNLGATTAKTTAEIPGVEAAARKTEAEIPLVGAQVAKTQAEIPLVGAQTAAARAEVPLKNAQTAKTASEVGIEGQKLDVEKGKIQIELARYASEHPGEPVPGFKYVGPGAPPSRDSAPVKELGDRYADTALMKKTLADMRAIYEKNGPTGRFVGSDAQRLDTLHETLMGAIGRAASGGRLAAYDVELAKTQLPRPSSLTGAFRPQKILAAIDELTKHADESVESFAKGHNFSRGEGAPASQPTGKVRLMDPKGNPFDVDAGEAADALAHGWTKG